MSLRQLVADRTTGHAGTAAIISNRCYPDRVPESATYPLVVYHVISEDPSDSRDHELGPVERTVNRVQMEGWAATGDAAEALGDQLLAAWDGWKDKPVVGYAFVANRFLAREDELGKFRDVLDVLIEHAV